MVGAGAWVRFQLGNHQAGQRSAWNSLGAKAWGLLGLGLTSRQGTAGNVRLGQGPSLKAPARFWQGPKATQRAGLCAKRAKGTDPAQAAVARGRQLGSGQRGGHHGRRVVSRWLVFTSSSLRPSWDAALCQAPPLWNPVSSALKVSWNLCVGSSKRGGAGAGAVVVPFPGVAGKTSQQPRDLKETGSRRGLENCSPLDVGGTPAYPRGLSGLPRYPRNLESGWDLGLGQDRRQDSLTCCLSPGSVGSSRCLSWVWGLRPLWDPPPAVAESWS